MTPLEDPRLQREAVVYVHDRGRFFVLVALCTLAGVAVGFALSTLVYTGHTCRTAAVAQTAPATPSESEPPATSAQPPATPPSTGNGFDPQRLFQKWRSGGPFGAADTTGWLGVSISDAKNGARVNQVVAGSPAETAGLRAGDVITQVDSEGVTTAGQLRSAVSSHTEGDVVTISVSRGKDELTLRVRLGGRP